MSSVISIFEHDTTSGLDWTEKDSAALRRLRHSVGARVLRETVSRGRVELKAAQHVGVFRIGGRSFQVMPKIYRPGAADKAGAATGNLLHLLSYAGHLGLREHGTAPLERDRDDWFEVLTHLFSSHLMAEWQLGPFRNYQARDDSLPVLKGRWRIADQIRRPHRQHLFEVTHDEFTADNQLNRVFRHVVERLWRASSNPANRQRLGELRLWMEDVESRPHLTAAEAAPAIITRLNSRYLPLLNLARLFLDGGALRLNPGDTSTFAFVFDMNVLFEQFVCNFILRHREDVVPDELSACEILPQAAGAQLNLARREGKEVFWLQPDIAFRGSGGHFPLLIDTKYKRLDKDEAKLGVSQSDFYQMHAYARRYRAPRVLLLYPQTAAMREPLRASFRLEGGDHVITAATVNITVDLGRGAGVEALRRELRELLSSSIHEGGGAND